MLFAYLTLFTALIISLSAAVYSILGLTAIFAAAFWPIVIMGGSLEVGKIVATLWLHKYWKRAELQYKAYLCFAVAILMMLTSMGVFGFLSKAHGDQSLVSGDSSAKVAIFDEKIKISRDNIDMNRKALTQMDAAVDQVMGRSSDEKGADKAVAIRRGQAAERARLLKEIDAEQKKITALNEERAPLAAENRKIEAEVGPVKYIAAMIYGDNPDANVLEKAVRWVIILIVIVFDPLALTLLLSATKAIEWERGIDIFNMKKRDEDEEAQEEVKEILDDAEQPVDQHTHIPVEDYYRDPTPDIIPPITQEELKHWDDFFTGAKSNQEVDKTFFPEVKLEPDPLPEPKPEYRVEDADYEDPAKTKEDEAIDEISKLVAEETLQATEPVREEDELTRLAKAMWAAQNPGENIDDHHALHDAGHITTLPWHNEEHISGLPISDGERKKLLAQMNQPSQFALQADNAPPLLGTVTGFGIDFPKTPAKGDMFLRVDSQPTVLYKFNGKDWMPVDKAMNDSYVYDDAYIDHLIDKIASGEYDLDLLNESEREQMALRLKDQQG